MQMDTQGIHAALKIRQRGANVVVVDARSVLTGAPFRQLTAKFVQRFADLGELMRIYTDAAAFDAALSKAASPESPGIGV